MKTNLHDVHRHTASVRTARRALWLTPLLALSLQIGCSGSDDDDASVEGDDDASSTPTPAPTQAPSALVTTSDYSTGGLATITLNGFHVVADHIALGGDTVVRTHGKDVYLLVRDFATGNDYVNQVDPNDDFKEIRKIDTGTGSNPHDMAFASGKGYISLYGGASNLGGVAVFDPATGTISKTIDLSDYADDDGNANADRMVVDGTTLYVGLQRVDYGTYTAQAGMLAKIDTSNDTVTASIDLTGTNVGTLYLESSGDLLVATSGVYNGADGGIERISKSSGDSSGFILTELELGINSLGGFAVANGTGYAISSIGLSAFELSDGSSLGKVFAASSVGATAVWAHGDQLWLSDGSGDVAVFDAKTETILTSGPLDVGASGAYSIAFWE